MCPESIVWADLRFNRTTPSNRRLIPSGWRVEKVETPNYVSNVTARESPRLLVFEFDRPDIPSLSSLSSIRRRFAAIPVLMLTEYHSEALAIWALRNHVTNYLVVPISQHELVGSVEEAMIASCSQGANPIPNELRFRTVACHKTAAAVSYVESHYYEAVREEAVAEVCNMCVSAFSRTFRKEQGKTFRDYLLAYRIGKACELLRVSGVNVTDVAFTVGFNDLSYFSRMFKRLMGQTPTGFQILLTLQKNTGTEHNNPSSFQPIFSNINDKECNYDCCG